MLLKEHMCIGRRSIGLIRTQFFGYQKHGGLLLAASWTAVQFRGADTSQ